jgi:predicted amidohydrolase YtcJ
MQAFLSEGARLGITSVQEMSLPAGAERCVGLLEKAATPIRVRVMRMAGTTSSARDTKEGRSLPRNPTPLITVSGTKWVLDGSPIESSAAMRKPYADNSKSSGWLNFNEKEMEAMLRESLENHDQLLAHIVGDRTTEAFLTAMEATGGKAVWGKRRVRIEHGDGVMPDLVSRTKDLGVVVVENPTHVTIRKLLVKRYSVQRAVEQLALADTKAPKGTLILGDIGPTALDDNFAPRWIHAIELQVESFWLCIAVVMGIVDSRNDHSPAYVDALRLWASETTNLFGSSGRNDALPTYRQRLHI